MKKRRSEISKPKEFGPVSEKWLNAIGVFTKSDLVRLGSIHAYLLLKERGFGVTLNMLYAMEGAILGVPWDQVPDRLKAELRTAIGVAKKR